MEGYREARKSLRTAIKRSKAKAWEELLQTLEEDPWGRPYNIVTNKLKPAAPPITETLDPEFVEEVITTLFPSADRENERGLGPAPQDQEWMDDLEVGMGELLRAIKRGFKGNTAPGPDGLHKKTWALASRVLAEHIRRLFNCCLKRGVFPPEGPNWSSSGRGVKTPDPHQHTGRSACWTRLASFLSELSLTASSNIYRG